MQLSLYCNERYIHCTLLYVNVRYCTLKYATIRYCRLLCATIRYRTLLYANVNYCTLPYATVSYRQTLRTTKGGRSSQVSAAKGEVDLDLDIEEKVARPYFSQLADLRAKMVSKVNIVDT